MDTSIAMTRLEAAFEQQVLVAGGDAEMESITGTLLAALGPVVGRIALDLAEQAAAEVSAQLTSQDVDVVLRDGEPTLRVRSTVEEPEATTESLDARITLRLPPTLKENVETAADELGESVNAWLVKTLSAHAGERRRSRRSRSITGTIET